jgi:flagellar motor switch protein FliN/FliY
MHKLDEKDADSAAHAKTVADDVDTPMTPQDTAKMTQTAASENAVFPHLDTDDTENALAAQAEEGGAGMNAMLNVRLDVQVVLGQARMPISRLLELTRGSIVELNRKIGAPVDLMVSGRLVARGDLVKVGEDRLGVSLTQIVKDYVPD